MKPVIIGTATLFNADCHAVMADMADQAVDLALVDPPYGLNIVATWQQARGNGSMFKCNGIVGNPDWDQARPDAAYFQELRRVSREQIVWGGNYFLDHLPATKCMVVWDKMNGTNPLADVELAWTSFDKPARLFRMHHFSQGYERKQHPAQKPVKLYAWLLQQFAQPGWRILDTHLGSGSSAIAAIRAGFEFVGVEMDPDYFAAAVARIETALRQQPLSLEEASCRN